MSVGNIQMSAKIANGVEVLIADVQQVMGDAVDLQAPRLYRAGQHIACGLITMEAAMLGLPPRTAQDAS